MKTYYKISSEISSKMGYFDSQFMVTVYMTRSRVKWLPFFDKMLVVNQYLCYTPDEARKRATQTKRNMSSALALYVKENGGQGAPIRLVDKDMRMTFEPQVDSTESLSYS